MIIYKPSHAEAKTYIDKMLRSEEFQKNAYLRMQAYQTDGFIDWKPNVVGAYSLLFPLINTTSDIITVIYQAFDTLSAYCIGEEIKPGKMRLTTDPTNILFDSFAVNFEPSKQYAEFNVDTPESSPATTVGYIHNSKAPILCIREIHFAMIKWIILPLLFDYTADEIIKNFAAWNKEVNRILGDLKEPEDDEEAEETATFEASGGTWAEDVKRSFYDYTHFDPDMVTETYIEAMEGTIRKIPTVTFEFWVESIIDCFVKEAHFIEFYSEILEVIKHDKKTIAELTKQFKEIKAKFSVK